jgi:hypothetical protein
VRAALQKAEELSHPPVSGKRYLVKLVYVPRTIGWARDRLWWPVHGPAHTDVEIGGGGAYRHYHLFIPFLTDAQLDGVSAHALWGQEYGMLAVEARANTGHADNAFTAEKWGPKVCRREWTPYPYEATANMRAAIAYSHKPLHPGCKVCPHRGMNLAMVPADASGVVTCPGHGLRWHLATGAPA